MRVELSVTVKLLMNWDIKPERDQEYFEFVVREWVPGITRLGLQPSEAWFTVYGEHPQIFTAGVADDLETMRGILRSADWNVLHEKLMEYVSNYTHKVVYVTNGGFQI